MIQVWNGKRVIGRWTVHDECQMNERGERLWLCRCECGTERFVLERSLKYGGSKSCGCLTRERAKEVISHQLQGCTFGDLTVLGESSIRKANGGKRWLCRCSCGNEIDVPGTLLVTGRKKHCGCKLKKKYAYRDITGRRFEMLTALYSLPERSRNGNVIWHCRCDCGNEVDVSYNELVYSMRKSCGCQKKLHDQQLHNLLTHVDGTSLDMIASKHIPSSNTSGVRGVYFARGKWCAKIVFQHKQYHLGQYDTLEEAARVRKMAEELLFDGAVEHYARWKQRASQDPEWAVRNPIRIVVSKKSVDEISVVFLPALT